MKKEDLSGQQFGLLTVIVESESKWYGDYLTRYYCSCECGDHCIVLAKNLKAGKTRSCGCQKGRPSKEDEK